MNSKENKKRFEQFCLQIESWKPEAIKAVLIELKGLAQSDYDEIQLALDKKYQQLIKSVSGKTMSKLSNLPTKWEGMNNEKRAKVIEAWPKESPFFTKVLNLNAKERVDRWRDSHFSNRFEEFPGSIGKLKGIRELWLHNQGLEDLPKVICELDSLEVLDLHNNDLESLPKEFINLKELRELNLSNNYGLEKIPDLGKLSQLEYIDFEYTHIKHLSDAFFELPNLRKIITLRSDLDRDTSIIKRMLDSFPNTEVSSGAIKAIEMEQNENLDEYKGMEKIKIDNFQLNTIPKALFHADVVKNLNIRSPVLKNFPDKLDQLSTLESFELDASKKLTPYPESISKLPNLKTLHLKGPRMPTGIGDLTLLQDLYVEHVRVDEIPKSLSNLKNLKTLKFYYTNNVHLSSNFAGLSSLESLKFDNAALINYPNIVYLEVDPKFAELKSLKSVNIELRPGEFNDSIFNLPQTIENLNLEVSNHLPDQHHTKLNLCKILRHFHRLKFLTLDGVIVTNDDEGIPENHPLISLKLYDTLYSSFPDSISNLKELTTMVLLKVRFDKINPNMYGCEKLSYLRMTNLPFETLPDGIEQLQELSSLTLGSCRITHLPEGIYEMKSLKNLSLGNTPLWRKRSFKKKLKEKIEGIEIDNW